ncbi:hypothetical protein F6X40_10165 [Paraburkholderia sp. UCT31]|uniref:hypothetical protein n=1 Tax=Paraburkholderia sp. UCT31 TaxID=2615209 RepID=UPI001654C279|nr:hypothetical protein [Paraburkholderia sp. UCT31]MBC8737172.1 hypothetical protein [Paraburkholderia sp. UCT31]
MEVDKRAIATFDPGYSLINGEMINTGNGNAAFVALAHEHMRALLACAEGLADAMPGIEAYANSLTNENYRTMWFTQLAKYKAALQALDASAE